MTTSAVDCEKDGHCWHQGTGVGSLYCCKCTNYLIGTLYEVAERSLREIDAGLYRPYNEVKAVG